MKKATTKMLSAILAMMCVTGSMFAADAVIKGVVTDSAGKPVRGATISVASGMKTVSRFSQKDGKYEITVAGGTYAVSVDAYGFAVKRVSVDTSKGGDTNVTLTPANLSVARLTGSEIESLLPYTPEGKLLRARCIECHSFPTIAHRRGQSAEDWKAFLPHMTRDTMNEPFGAGRANDEELDALSGALAKYFGPDSPYLSPDSDNSQLMSKVKHVEPSDEALMSTVIEYNVPTKDSHAHSIEVDLKTNVAWFGEEGFQGNKATRFNMNTESFQEFPLLTERARPHTGTVAPDGTYYVALADGTLPPKLASVDPETGKVTQYNWPEMKVGGAHTLTLDRKGTIWFSGGSSGDLWSFDLKTQKFSSHLYPVPASYPKGSAQEWDAIPGEATRPPQAASYDVTIDNEGMVWFSQVSMGTLVKMNPATGEIKSIRPEGAVSIRGIVVDPQDNLWFGDFHGHRFGKLNVKTGEVRFFQPPTPNATAYGVSYNPVDGNVWYGDMSGNNVTRFNPKTEKFTEYRIPRQPDRAYDRFIGADAKGRVWFTEYFGDRIGFVDPTGESTGSQITSTRAAK
jgi:virginiamycin B lyase